MSTANSLPDSPYRGLLYFESDHTAIFAGRNSDSKTCAQRLMDAPVLILHGRTGCGKSSFLRAGLAPFLEMSKLEHQFIKGAQAEFKVTRSGPLPLRALAGDIWDLGQEIKKSPDRFGNVIGDINAVLDGAKSRMELELEVGRSSYDMYEFIKRVGACIDPAPIFVIDQAEEVLTLRQTTDFKRYHVDDAEVDEEVEEYFEFLSLYAEGNPGSKVIVSLRTEYKGLFDDRMAGDTGRSGVGVHSFYLEELGIVGLKKAILCPTLDAPDVSDGDAKAGSDGASPYSKYRFRFAPGVDQRIAEDLLESAPSGGVLPVLQVACLQLYEKTRPKKDDSRTEWEIMENDWASLGSPDQAVGSYLADRLRGMLIHLGREPSEDAVSDWRRLLLELVGVEPDGRTVTRKVFQDHLMDRAVGFGAVEDQNDIAGLEFLARPDIGILRVDGELDARAWTLGHDSLGLALERWNKLFNRSGRVVAKADSNSARQARTIQLKDLYTEDDLPVSKTYKLPVDLLWDHRLPHFALQRGFAERLGIHFEVDDDLKPLALGGPDDIETMNDLKESILKRQGKDETRNSVLVAFERSRQGFPGDSDDAKAQEWTWSDVLVTNLFMGNALVGPAIDGQVPLSTFEEYKSLQRNTNTIESLSDILMYLTSVKARILCSDETASAMFKVALLVCGLDLKLVDKLKFEVMASIHTTADELRKGDILFDRFVKEAEKTASGAAPVFMVGTAFGRALATQSKYTTYFTSQHLHRLVEGYKRDNPESQTVASTYFQRTLQHTLWQVGVPPGMWNRGIDRVHLLRLASIGFYTAEYVLADPEDFTAYLFDWLSKEDLGAGTKVAREVISEMVRNCFSFFAFEEYARLIFDHDDTFAYWLGHLDQSATGESRVDIGLYGNRSVAFDIYSELIELRGRTINHFQSVCRSTDWLRRQAGGIYDVSDGEVGKAFLYKSMAWRHFRIYNFVDSERYMSRAAAKLHRYVEGVARGAAGDRSLETEVKQKAKSRKRKPT